MRLGLSPAVTNNTAAVSAPTPGAANSAGLTGLGAEMVDLGGEFSDLCGEGLVSAGQGTQRRFGVSDGGVGCAGTETGAGLYAGFGRKSSKLVSDLVGSGNNQGVQLVDGLGAGLGRRTAGHREHSYRFDWTVTAFGHCGGLSAENRPSRGLRVGGVSFTEPPA